MRITKILTNDRGISTIELMVVVAIGLILVSGAVLSSYSSIKKAQVSRFGIELGSLLERARGIAMSRGCPMRIVFCDQIDCRGPIQLSAGGNAIQAVSVVLLRYAPIDPQLDCSSDLHSSDDGFEFWERDSKPLIIPSGVVVSPIYQGSGLLDVSDWSQAHSTAASRSIWFETDGQVHSPSESALIDDARGEVFFQIRDQSCDPILDDQCVGWLISMDRDGGSHLTSCGSEVVPCRGLQD